VNYISHIRTKIEAIDAYSNVVHFLGIY